MKSKVLTSTKSNRPKSSPANGNLKNTKGNMFDEKMARELALERRFQLTSF